jgi:hypothetical protein
LYAKALADKYKDSHKKIQVVSLHPGVIKTALYRSTSGVIGALVSAFVADKSIPQGASTTVYACVAPEIQTDEFRGAYLADCNVKTPTAAAQDVSRATREALLEVTEKQLAAVTAEL